ncbi:MAG: glycosyltransferase, partial [Rhodospirillaceae bacterium]
MRLLQVMAGAEFGGAEAFFVRLAGALQRAGVAQKAVIRTHPTRAAELRAAGVETSELKFGGAMDWQTPRGLKREIAQFKPDIVMTWMNRATAMCPKSAKDAPFKHIARLGGYYDLKYYRACDHLIGNTENIVAYLVKEGWPTERAHYLPNFVDAEPAEMIRRQLHYTPETVPLILAMGRLHENKGFDILLDALARVPNAYLWIAGEGPLRAQLEKMAEELAVKPRVRFLGWRSDIPALLATCDLFVCPSRHEPLGNAVIESWAHGRPVVAADSYGPGTLIDHMESGILVPTEDAVMLAKAICLLIGDPELAHAVAVKGHETLQAHFTEAAVVRQYL